jgi:hypothetical protein
LNNLTPSREALRLTAAQHAIPANDVDAVAERALRLLSGLHEGSLARYRLRPSDFKSWKASL